MKALIISDDQNFIDTIDSYLQSKDFNTIIYRWLLKAMDNIEEIRPELVIVSSQEYPRHWKTLAQFAKSGIGASDTKVVLYQQDKMNEEDGKKARELGVSGIFYSYDEEGLFDLSKILLSEDLIKETADESSEDDVITVDSILSESFDDEPTETAAETTDEPEITAEPEEAPSEEIEPFVLPEDAALIFTNPVTKTIVTGKITAYENKQCTLKVDNPSLVENLTSDDLITEITIQMDKCVSDYQGFLISNDENLVLAVESTDEE